MTNHLYLLKRLSLPFSFVLVMASCIQSPKSSVDSSAGGNSIPLEPSVPPVIISDPEPTPKESPTPIPTTSSTPTPTPTPKPPTTLFNQFGASTLVVYNSNARDAKEIADYYSLKRNIPAANLCEVRVPLGNYMHYKYLLAARKKIVESCLCEMIPIGSRPACSLSNAATILSRSKVSYMALIRGIPPRLTGTPWTGSSCLSDCTDSEEPSADYYLSNLISTSTAGDKLSARVAPKLNSLSYYYYWKPNPSVEGFVPYGRIEAIDYDRTLKLIDRTLDAEARGFQGNIVNEYNFDNDPAGRAPVETELVGQFDPKCREYLSHTPFSYNSLLSSWPYQSCRYGSTHTDIPISGATSDLVPGQVGSTIPYAVNIGFLNGNSSATNGHSGFNVFSTMLYWRKSDVTCVPLCSSFPSEKEKSDCRARSTDYFRELNTDCVGAAPGLFGWQYRSYPVQYYGFGVPGWSYLTSGDSEKTVGHIAHGDAFQNNRFSDNAYLRLDNGDYTNTTCDLESGSTEPCPQGILLSLQKSITISPIITVVDGQPFNLKFRYRNSGPGGKISVSATLYGIGVGNTQAERDTSAAESYTLTNTFTMLDARNIWKEASLTFLPYPTAKSNAGTVRMIGLILRSPWANNIQGSLDLDGIEMVYGNSTTQLIDLASGSFSSENYNFTTPGDWAANMIDRLGAVAHWGSSSHHVTGGNAFPFDFIFTRTFFAGRTLGHSLLADGWGMSGIIYGDPLYRPIAVKLHMNGQEAMLTAPSFYAAPGPLVNSANKDTYKILFVNAFLGESFTQDLRWQMDVCPSQDLPTCFNSNLWRTFYSGVSAREDFPVDWMPSLGLLKISGNISLRLKVWRPQQPLEPFYSYAYFQISN